STQAVGSSDRADSRCQLPACESGTTACVAATFFWQTGTKGDEICGKSYCPRTCKAAAASLLLEVHLLGAVLALQPAPVAWCPRGETARCRLGRRRLISFACPPDSIRARRVKSSMLKINSMVHLPAPNMVAKRKLDKGATIFGARRIWCESF